MGLGPDCWWGQGGLSARIKTKRKSIAQRPQRAQRGELRLGPNCWGDKAASVRESRQNGKASHRGHKGGVGVGSELLGGTRPPQCENQDKTEKHRTEATKVTEGGIEVGSELLGGTRPPQCENRDKTEKHRTEATEVTEGELGWVQTAGDSYFSRLFWVLSARFFCVFLGWFSAFAGAGGVILRA